jgi:hypothetical protein
MAAAGRTALRGWTALALFVLLDAALVVGTTRAAALLPGLGLGDVAVGTARSLTTGLLFAFWAQAFTALHVSLQASRPPLSAEAR